MKVQVIDGYTVIDGSGDPSIDEPATRLAMDATDHFMHLLSPLFCHYGIEASCNAVATIYLRMLGALPEEYRDVARQSAKRLPDALEIAFATFDRGGCPIS